MKENLLVTLANKNYINQAKQLFSSVYWKAGWKGDYMLLAHEIPEKDLKWFRDKGILIKKCKPLYNQEINGYSPIVLDKFYLFTPEFKKWKNIVYLDADIIVRASLEELTKINGFASPNVFDQYQFLKDYFFQDNNLKNKLKKFYNLNKPALNSGVMAFNTEIIKTDSFENLITLFNKYKTIAFGDDSIFNIFFYKKWKKISILYDILPKYLINSLYIKPDKIKGIILHFISKESINKPWNTENYFYPEWKNNLEKSELINLNTISPAKKLSKIDICSYSFYLRIKEYFFYKLKPPSDRFIGKIGLFIKKYDLDLYYKLKKVI